MKLTEHARPTDNNEPLWPRPGTAAAKSDGSHIGVFPSTNPEWFFIEECVPIDPGYLNRGNKRIRRKKVKVLTLSAGCLQTYVKNGCWVTRHWIHRDDLRFLSLVMIKVAKDGGIAKLHARGLKPGIVRPA